MIVQIIFWGLVLALLIALVFHENVNCHISIGVLKGLAVCYSLLVVAYIVYVACTFERRPADIILSAFGYMVLFGCVWLTYALYLPKTIHDEKVYTMHLTEAYKRGTKYKIYGLIQEGTHRFEACFWTDDKKYLELHAGGYFDHMCYRSVFVKLKERKVQDAKAVAEMELA